MKFELPRFVWTVQKAPLAYLKGFSLETIVTAVMFSMVGYFNGHGQTLWVMIQGLVQTLLVRLPLAYIMSIQPDANRLCGSGGHHLRHCTERAVLCPAETAGELQTGIMNRKTKPEKPHGFLRFLLYFEWAE